MLPRMSGNWFKKIFSSSGREGAEAETDHEMIDINEARLDAGGGGLGVPEYGAGDFGTEDE
jgi:hypothetical protein